jgi:two-component system alkaline phosphatase synthesis response regulator PhoP
MTMVRILVVEDHEDTSLLLKTFFGQLGYDVLVIETMADALKHASLRGFDVYLLDTRLPDGSGIELCRRIRTLDAETPIVFYSAAAQDSMRAEALAAGAQDYVVKPALPSEVARVLARYLPKGRASACGGA